MRTGRRCPLQGGVSRRQPHRSHRQELSWPMGIHFPGLTSAPEPDPPEKAILEKHPMESSSRVTLSG